MHWAELNSRQLGKLSRDSICVLPIGALEQHGPHLPVATDSIIAEAMSGELDAACRNELLVMPAIRITCSRHHMGFPGTLSINHLVFQRLVIQTLESAAAQGFHHFFLLNAHGGNMAIGGVILEQLAQTLPDCDVVFATWFRAAAKELLPLVEGEYPAVGHACEFETSLVMAVRPELVDCNAIEDDGVASASPLLRSDMLHGGPVARSVPFDQITSSGVWGKPSLASAEKGRAILSATIPVLKNLLVAHWPDAPGLDNTINTNGRHLQCDSSLLDAPLAGRRPG